jgi:hypothetical protein
MFLSTKLTSRILVLNHVDWPRASIADLLKLPFLVVSTMALPSRNGYAVSSITYRIEMRQTIFLGIHKVGLPPARSMQVPEPRLVNVTTAPLAIGDDMLQDGEKRSFGAGKVQKRSMMENCC